MINVLIADKQALTREGIISVLSVVKDVKVTGQAASPASLEQMINLNKPDVIIIDHFNINDIKRVSTLFDPAHMLIISNRQQKNGIKEVIDLGIKTYISKKCSKDELIKAVYAAAKGKQFFCERILNELAEDKIIEKDSENTPQLSTRETELVHLIAEGLTNKEIAERLFLSIHTVKTHRKNIIKKLGFTFKNAADLISIIGNK